MCWYHSPLLSGTKSGYLKYKISYHKFKLLINDLRRLQTKNIFITGEGEAFLHPDILKMLKLVKQSKMKCSVMLNVNMLTKEMVTELIKLRIDNIQLSTHIADSQTYKKVYPTQPEEKFNQILKSLNYFKKLKGDSSIPRLEIINVIFKLNYKTVGNMIELAESIGADMLTFKRAIISLPFRKKLDLTEMENKQLIEILAKYKNIKVKNNIGKFINSLRREKVSEFIDAELNKKHKDTKRTKTYRYCYVPYTNGIILVDGEVLTCNYDPNAVRPGNINKQRFKDIWFSKKYNNYRRERRCHHCFATPNYPFLDKVFKFFSKGR
jgi:MoaA/NifB/PqqE/SkfB family radical SAM enzyme